MESRRKANESKRIYVGDPNVFDVDCILQRRNNGTETEYLIKWSGYPDSENSWVKESDVTPDLVKSFNAMNQFKKSTGKQISSVTQTSFVESTLPVPNQTNGSYFEEGRAPVASQNKDSYFEEGFHNFGFNVMLTSVTEDFRLFPSPTVGADESGPSGISAHDKSV